VNKIEKFLEGTRRDRRKSVEMFRITLWEIFHAVEEEDWGRIEPAWFEWLRIYVADFNVSDQKKEDFIDYVNSLERFCRLRDKESAFWMIARILFEAWFHVLQ